MPRCLDTMPWGARRNPDGTTADPASFALQTGSRQFTGQEQIPDVGLVNMNGRVYDPVLGRFLSPDPHVQFVADLQSYNRYTYVGNNPLRYTDPTGYWLSAVGNWFGGTFGNPWNDFQLLATIGVCATLGPAGCTIAGLYFAALNATIAVANGAAWDQTVVSTGIGLGVGTAVGSAVGSFTGGELVGLLSGSASAAVTTGISNLASGQGFWGWDMLGAAFLSAAQGAATLGLKQALGVSEGSAYGEVQGAPAQEAGGTGEAQVEKVETVESYLASQGYSGGDAVDHFLAKQGDLGWTGPEPVDPDVLAEAADTESFQEDARAAYQRYGTRAQSVDQLESEVDRALSSKYGRVGIAGNTSSSGQVQVAYDPNPLTRDATTAHEDVHAATTAYGRATYGAGTQAFNKWWTNPQNWAADEVNAYSAGIHSLQTAILFSVPYRPGP